MRGALTGLRFTSNRSEEKIEALANLYEQRSQFFYANMRDNVLKNARNESKKRHARVQTICEEGKAKPMYPASLF